MHLNLIKNWEFTELNTDVKIKKTLIIDVSVDDDFNLFALAMVDGEPQIMHCNLFGLGKISSFGCFSICINDYLLYCILRKRYKTIVNALILSISRFYTKSRIVEDQIVQNKKVLSLEKSRIYEYINLKLRVKLENLGTNWLLKTIKNPLTKNILRKWNRKYVPKAKTRDFTGFFLFKARNVMCIIWNRVWIEVIYH